MQCTYLFPLYFLSQILGCYSLGRLFLHEVSLWRLLVRLRDTDMNAMLRLESLRRRRLRFCPHRAARPLLPKEYDHKVLIDT
jgi:hypothetical protein